MLQSIKKIYREWCNYRTFSTLKPDNNRLIFYSEGHSNWVHFEPIIKSLREDFGKEIIYLTSDENESKFLSSHEGITSFYIGNGIIRTMLFTWLKAKVMVMTMPDLQTFHIKRSIHPVNYVYVHHSMVSCHMIYKPNAFDHFDTIFCVGPHHIEEIRSWESLKQLKQKRLIRHGYGRLDKLIQEQGLNDEDHSVSHPARILIAPSWGNNSILERHSGTFIKLLLEKGFHVTLRPHPQTRYYNSSILDTIEKELCSYENFIFEEKITLTKSLIESDLMVSDWSGAALEFAFSRLKPVLFVDVPRKVNNPEYQILNIEPIEVFIRNEIGLIMPEDQLPEMSTYIEKIMKEASIYPERIRQCREKFIYNIGESGKVGAKEIIGLI